MSFWVCKFSWLGAPSQENLQTQKEFKMKHSTLFLGGISVYNLE